MNAKHTKTLLINRASAIYKQDDCIAQCYGNDIEAIRNARHIVHSVNLHDELVKTIENLTNALAVYGDHREVNNIQRNIEKAKQVLSKAKGE